MVWASDTQECAAAPNDSNPRYIEKELQMQYGENKGAHRISHETGSFLFSTPSYK